MNDSDVPSPCISICVLDEQEVCMGCYRSAVEVTDWFMAGNEEKLEILQRAAARRRDAQRQGHTRTQPLP